MAPFQRAQKDGAKPITGASLPPTTAPGAATPAREGTPGREPRGGAQLSGLSSAISFYFLIVFTCRVCYSHISLALGA